MMIFVGIIAVVFGVFLAGFFAGTETGIYRISLFKLRLAIEQKHRAAKLLGSLLGDSQSLILSMLIGTNLTQYIVTGIVTMMFIHSTGSDSNAQIYTTAVMTPILFVFAELIPKNIFIYHADWLMPRVSVFIWAFQKIFKFTGIVYILRNLALLVNKLTSAGPSVQPAIVATQRHQISQIAAETIEEGILTPAQSRIISRLIKVPDIKISEVMTAIDKTCCVDVNSSYADLTAVLAGPDFTRLPVYESSKQNIIGYINIYEVLASDTEFKDLRGFFKPLISFDTKASVSSALGRMCRQNQRIVLITSDTDDSRALGIVTIKDLVEEFVGELTHI